MYKLGIDLGGTKIEGIVLDPEGKEVYRHRVPTEQEKGYEHILHQIYTLYELLMEHTPEKIFTLGLGTPGAISKKTKHLKNSNTLCLNGKPFKEDLEQVLGHPLEIQNDANCFAMAEALYGAGQNHDLVFGVIIGTGCGGGIVYKSEVITGQQSIAGEWGHMSMDPCGPQCYCGNRGCVETLISGGALEKRYQVELEHAYDLKTIIEKYREEDPDTLDFMDFFFENFGRAMANLINILDPDIIVLGGGVSNIDELYVEGITQAKKYIFNDEFETPIVKNELGDSAGVIGAALIGS